MPASRPYWKGYLKLSFVSCPVALYPATSAAERVSFRQVNRRTGHRLKHKLVDSVTGEAIDASDKARGYEIGENEFLFVEDRDLAQARSERPPPGSIPLAEPPPRESPPTVPARAPEFAGRRPSAGGRRTRRRGAGGAGRGARPARAAAAEHAHDRDRALSSGRADRCALFREAVLHRSARAGRPGSVRRDPRRHEPCGRYRPCPRGVVVARAAVSD